MNKPTQPTMKEVISSLCSYDTRNPDFIDTGELFGDDWIEETRKPYEKDCGCDNCFYGRSRLAVEILRLRKFKKGG